MVQNDILFSRNFLISDTAQNQLQFCKRLPDVIVIGVKKCGTITLGKKTKNITLANMSFDFREISELPPQHGCNWRDSFL